MEHDCFNCHRNYENKDGAFCTFLSKHNYYKDVQRDFVLSLFENGKCPCRIQIINKGDD
jgi:hypothetical protein